MKKLVLLLIVMFSNGFTKANPIAPPPVISEFYLVNDSTWYLELVFTSQYPYSISNLDGMSLESSFGSVLFKNGISVAYDSIIIITQDSMQGPLHFNRNGDYILLSNFVFDYIYFGNIVNTQISAPLVGQSIVNMSHSCYDGNFITTYLLVKDNNPTIGYSPFQPSVWTSIFTGFVFDSGHNPVSGIKIGNSTYYGAPPGYCPAYFNMATTNSSGSFSVQEYCLRYNVELFLQQYHVLMDSVVNIEPDSVNYYEFTLDRLLTGIQTVAFETGINFSCFPNPTTGETNITFTNPTNRHFSKALVKIYDTGGEIVSILPVNMDDVQDKYSIKWDGLCYDNSAASGIYFCKLELDGQKVASSKIIIAR
jgi:hypothetical protein